MVHCLSLEIWRVGNISLLTPLGSTNIIVIASKIADRKVANDNRFLDFINMLAAIKANNNNKLHVAADIRDKIYIIVRKTDSEHSQLSFSNS